VGDGLGWLYGASRGPKLITGSDPAAGAECSDAVPTGKAWQLLSWAVTLAQGITQTPLPDLIIDDGTSVIYQAPLASSAQNASVTAQYFAAPGLTLGAGGAATRINAPLPLGLILPAGFRIRTVTAGIGANSNYGSPRIFVVEHGG
jgi:hypothetical protein